MKIYNTLTRKLEKFIPIEEGKVRFYHCGPTVYWTQHIGNMRAMVLADTMRKSLEYLGYNVTFVRNYTDVGHLTGDNLGDADTGEDRMEKGARREGITPQEVAEKYINIFENHLKKLNISDPNHKPRATRYINEMIEMVSTLLQKGYAYSTDLAIYFDVSKFPDYNKLNRQKIDLNISGAGTGEVNDPNKKHSADFALWFFKAGVHKNALQYWASPFNSPLVSNGEGFPGWHIECSAMSKTLLGNTIDIHMGGVEHISIHHTNEIAQSEAASGVKFVNYWIHNGHLLIDNKKMSKSEGTAYSLDEIEEKGYNPLDLRYFFLQSNYRTTQNFTYEALDNARNSREKIINFVQENIVELIHNGSKINFDDISQEYNEKFKEYIGNDFDIPLALSLAWQLIKENIDIKIILATLYKFDYVFSIGIKTIIDKLLSLKKQQVIQIENLVSQRNKYRLQKNWTKSDEIRDKLNKMNIILKDEHDKTIWQIKE